MTELEVFAALAFAHAIAVVSPGPDFAIITRYSIVYGKDTAFWTSLGIGSGILVHVFYSIVGLGILIATNSFIFNSFKYAGAAYLLFLAYQGWRSGERHRKDKLSIEMPSKQDNKTSPAAPLPQPMKAYRDGLLTNALNAKASMFFIALFLLLTYDSPLLLQVVYGAYLSLATILYFFLLSWFYAGFRPFLQAHIGLIEKGTALVLAFFALMLAFFTGQPNFG